MKAGRELWKLAVVRNGDNSSTECICIAVVEDDIMYRQAIEVSLKKVPGSRVMGYVTGEECLKNYHKHKPDIFVLDYRLAANGAGEVMNGIEVLRKVKLVNNQAPVIFLSSAANTEVAITAIKAGAIDFIAKDRNGLARLINQVRKASIAILVKRQESKVTKWIAIGVLCIAVMVIGTVLANSGGFNDLWNWLWFALSIVGGVVVIRAWVRSSRNDYNEIQTAEYIQNGKWID